MACKGRIYRGRINAYVSNGKYVYQESMSFLKRESCKGCDKCNFLEDYLHEFACDIDGNLPIIKNIKDQALYKLKIVNMSRDWETGYVDEFDLEFVELKSIQSKQVMEQGETETQEIIELL